jgi:predicted GIY-YIG superfamily endonuclease
MVPSEALAKEGWHTCTLLRSCFALRSLGEEGFAGNLRRGGGSRNALCLYFCGACLFPDERYVGVTTDLKRRLADHNGGDSPHTSKFAPWVLVTYIAFSDGRKAESFERYLKSGSGHAFARKRFW